MNKLELMKHANEVRKGIITGTFHAKSGHPGGSLSAADIFTYLFFEEMNIQKIQRKQTVTVLCYQKDTRLRVIMPHWQKEDFSRWRIWQPFVKWVHIYRDIQI